MSAENISMNGGPESKVNFNTAPEEELVVVPGVGPAMARRIIEARPFEEVTELERVTGIGPNLLERIKPYLTLENQTPESHTYEVLAAAEPVVEEIIEAEVEEIVDDEAEEEPVLEAEILDIAAEEVDFPEEVEVEEVVFDLEAGLDEEAVTEPVEILEPEPIEAVAEVVEPAPQPVPAESKTLTRAQAFWLAFGTGLLSFVLALIVSLGVIAAILAATDKR